MKKNNLSLILLFSILSLQAQNIFPSMEVETLENKKIQLPYFTKGKYTLLGLAYSKKSEKALNTWYQPVFNKFIKPKLGGGGFFNSFTYDINTYFIPMFTGVNAAATGTAKKKAIKNVDPKLQPYILFYKGKIKAFKEALNFNAKDIPYFFLLDEEGRIIFQTTGTYSNNKLSQIENEIEDF